MTDLRSGGHFVYVLRCGDDTFYTGYTTDVERRVREHDAGDGAKYTRGRGPVELVHVETYESQSAAMSREYEIKQLSRSEKGSLVEADPAPDLDAGAASTDGHRTGGEQADGDAADRASE